MQYNKIMILAILLVSLLAVSAVSAADNATSDIAGVENQEDTLITDGNNSITPDFDDIVITTPKTFTDLNTLINDNNDSDVYLDDNYTFNTDSDDSYIDGITVNRAVTVHGNGHTINGANTARIFTVSTNNVVFQNIVFVNGNSNNGGAIYSRSNFTAVNCTFINNSATNYGGAMYLYGSSSSAVNCTFINNTAYEGGAMYGSSCSAVNSNFIGNSAYWTGGAMDGGSAVNCTFINNSAKSSSYGGAMRYGDAVNCTFINNTANQGGAMDHGSAVNCTFIGNSATKYEGGAIRYGDAVNCTFVNNFAMHGGAMYGGSAVDCTFIGNSADRYEGGAMSDGSAVNCTFVNNSAKEGGAMDGGSAVNCTFINNTAENGGAMHGSTSALNCSFSGNHANRDGGAVYDVAVVNGLFEYNSAKNGGAMSDGAAIDCQFNYNAATDYGGAVYNANVSTTSQFSNNNAPNGKDTYDVTWYEKKENSKSFTELKNLIDEKGSDIYLNDNYAFDLNSEFDLINGFDIDFDTIIHGNGFTIDGSYLAHIFTVTADNVVFKDIVFINAVSEYGGAINVNLDDDSYVSVVNCTFIGNSARDYGGAIRRVSAMNCTFIDNSAYGGGAMSGGSAVNCTFIGNSARNNGGAMSGGSAVNCTFINNSNTGGDYGGGAMSYSSAVNCTFINNSNTGGDYGGGAIIWGDAVNCTFINNSNTGRYGGGAMYGSSCSAVNCTFIGNHADSEYGGAMSGGSAENCTFIGNSARDYGGAMSGGSAVNCTFIGNSAKYEGGAIRRVSAVNCTFINNTAEEGGAMSGGSALDCTFIGNSAREYGGAMYDSSSAVNCTFINNAVTGDYGGGGAIARVSAVDCTFINNTVDGYDVVGGAMCGGSAVNCSFINNSAAYGGGAIAGYVMSGGTAENCIFIGNHAYGWGGAMYYGSAVNCSFEGNHVDDSGGAMWGGSAVDCTFIGNTAQKGGAMCSGSAVNSTFINNYVDYYGGYYIDIPSGDDSVDGAAMYGGSAVNCTFVNNDVYDVDTVNCTFIYSAESVITASNLTAVYGVSEELVVKLTDADGNALSGAQITVLFNNNYYNAATDSDGEISISIPDDLIPNTYEATASYAGSIEYKSSQTTATVVVNKAAVDISCEDVSMKYNDGSELVAILTNNGTGNTLRGITVAVNINGVESRIKTDYRGQVKVPISGISPGEYVATISFDGNDYYSSASDIANVIVGKADTVISAQDVTVAYNDTTVELVATITDAYGNALAVNLNVNGVIYPEKADSKGQIHIPLGLLPPGSYAATISYAGDVNYNPSNTTANVVVNKVSPVLTIDDVVAVHNTSSAVVVATLKDSYGNVVSDVKVKIVVGTLSKIARTDANGQVSLDISSLGPGEYNIAARSGVTDIYNEAKTNAHAVIYANKLDTTLTIPDVIAVGNAAEAVVVATLKDELGNLISGVKVKIVVGSLSKIARTDANGQVSMDISSLEPGQYKISSRSAVTDIYNEAKATAKAIISEDKLDTTLTIPDVIALYNTEGAVVVATLKDSYGNLISGVKVKIVVGSLSKIARTNENGQVTMDISSLEPGEYKISARSGVTDIYNEAKATAKAIIVDKFNTTLSIPDVEFGYGTSGVVVATLKDMVGNVVSGVKVKIVVGDLSKIARTDANGQVTMDISSLGVGEYKISARSGITDIYNEAKATATANVTKITPSLVIPNAVAVYNTEGNVVATLKDAAGNAISDLKVKIVVGTLSKIARTDANGQVTMNISSLAPGEYRISARTAVTDIYNEAKTTATAIVSEDKIDTTLTIPDVEIQQGNGAAVATLKDAYGNIISGVKVKIVVGSLSKIARTDENGQVSLDISSLAPGEYKISARSAITDVFNEAKVKAKATIYAN